MESILSYLTNDQYDSVLEICVKEEVPPNYVIYEEGHPSRDMCIVMDGVLKVMLLDIEIARIFAISIVGEMGLFTGEARSAKVVTITKSTLLKVTKNDLFKLFENDKDLYIQFQKAIINDMAQKIRKSNEVMAKLRSKADKGR